MSANTEMDLDGSETSHFQVFDASREPYDPLLAAALRTAQDEYSLSNPKSSQAHEEACLDFPGGNTRTVIHASPFPMTFVNGKGAELTSLDGRVYVDFLGEYSASIYGHSNEKISQAVSEAMSKGWNYGGPNTYERELARKITKRFSPSGVELVRFTNSGTEASTMAVAAALAFTNRKKILVFTSGYHGGTMSFPSPLNSINANLPHEFVLAPYNDVEGTKRVLSSLPRDSLAAIVVEGVQGSGGCVVGNPFFLHFLNATARELGAVFIMDEVMTSRLAYHGLSAKLTLKPDLIILRKWVGGGMTFGAFGGSKNIMSMFDPRTGVLGHSGTFNNNVITMAAGCCGLDIYDEHEVERLNAMGEDLLQRIQIVLVEAGVRAFKADSKTDPKSSRRGELDCPFSGILPAGFGSEKTAESLRRPQKNSMGATGQGSMLNIHFYGPSTITLRALFWHHMLDCGIYIAQRGFLALNLELTNGNVDEFEEAVRTFLNRYGDALR